MQQGDQEISEKNNSQEDQKIKSRIFFLIFRSSC